MTPIKVFVPVIDKSASLQIGIDNVFHALKEQELYCFTKAEIELLVIDAYSTGVLSANSDETGYFQSPKDYLKSLNL
jgi:hypothetical protein